ncbi:MAG: winged helix-turn-helix transcriptional regulator, partial [Sphingomicrobium sp.]
MQLNKVTNEGRNEAKRSYDDACGTAHALDLIGERWALLVLRELMLGPRRFTELKSDLPGISSNVLAQRLVELERRGLARKLRLPPPASVQVYEATEWGLEAEPIVQALGRWAARSPRHDPTLPISGVSILLSFRTMIDPHRARGIDARIGFRFGESA